MGRRSSRQSVRTWTANDTHIQTKMLKWPIRECKAVNRSGYGYGGKRVNPTNLALDGRKLVDYSSSDDSPPNDVDDSPTSPPRKMLRRAPTPQAVLRPGRTDIALKIPEWGKLRELTPEMLARSHKLRTAYICGHDNQEGYWTCPECCPNGIA